MPDLPLVLLLLLAAALLLRLDVVFYIVYVLAGTYALARWWTGNSLRRLEVQRRYTDHIFTGEKTCIEIEIANRSRWPVPWLRYEETPPLRLGVDEPLRQAVSLRAQERVRFCYELVGQQRGYYLVGPGVLRTGDLFGFAEAEGVADAPSYLVVYPRVLPLAHVELTSRSPHGTIASRQQLFADPTRVAGVRPYRSGDPRHSIDWKSSARSRVFCRGCGMASWRLCASGGGCDAGGPRPRCGPGCRCCGRACSGGAVRRWAGSAPFLCGSASCRRAQRCGISICVWLNALPRWAMAGHRT